MVLTLFAILSVIPAFVLVRALFRVKATSKVSNWTFYWLAAVIAFIVNPVFAIIGLVLVGEIFSFRDKEYIGMVIGPFVGIGIITGILGATVAIMLSLRNR